MKALIKNVLLVGFVGFGLATNAQTLERTVVSSGGDQKKASGMEISFTVGEPAITTVKKSEIVVTQGFQQPTEEATSLKPLTVERFQISMFPNPSQDAVYIKSEKAGSFDLVVYDARGRMVHTQFVDLKENGEQLINIEDWSVGQYHFQFVDKQNNTSTDFKVLKQ